MRGIILVLAGAAAMLVALAGDGAGHVRSKVDARATIEAGAGAGTSAELRLRP